MEERDIVLIERYLAGELTLSERAEVERRAQEEPAFKKEFTEYMMALEAIRLAGREELKNRFRQRDKILDGKSAQVKRFNPGNHFWKLAAGVLIMILLGWLIYKGYQKPYEENIITEVEMDSVIDKNIDTTGSLQNTELRASNEEKKENKKILKTRNKSEELYADNFEPYRDESMEPMARGDEDELSAFEQFELYYWDKNFEKAVAAFESMSESQKQNDNLRFLYANALMGLGKTDKAINILTDIIKNNKSIYKVEANLFLALSYLRVGNESEAKKHLDIYLKDESSEQKEKARKILAGID